MDDMCRLCLCTEGSFEELFDASKPDIIEKILQCTSIAVEYIPGLPSCICEICKSEITIWYKFRKQCIESNERLKEKYPELFTAKYIHRLYFEDEGVEYLEVDADDEYNVKPYFIESEEFDSKKALGKCALNDYCENNKQTNDFGSDHSATSVKDEDAHSGNTLERYNDAYVINVVEELEKQESTTDNFNGETNETLDEYEIVAKEETAAKVKIRKGRENSKKVVKIVNGNKVKYHKICSVCGKMQQNLKQHMLVHTGEKPYECRYCQKRFRQQCNLKHHLNTHTGEKPYACKLCDKKFGDPASVKSHMVLHTGERRYRCEICGSAFGYSHTLTLHRRTHTNDRRHECDLCGKKFISKHALKKHIRTHTGEKPYNCSVCSKSFSTSGNLSMHKRVHTQERPYKCPICNTAFKYNCVLNTHLKKH